MLSPERVAAIVAVLNDQALTPQEGRQKNLWGVGEAAGGQVFGLSLATEDTRVVAHAKEMRATPEKAFADAVELRRALVDASGGYESRGVLAAEAINDDALAVVGWVGAVTLSIPADRLPEERIGQ